MNQFINIRPIMCSPVCRNLENVTIYSPVVTNNTTCYNLNKTLYFAHMIYLCVFCCSQNKRSLHLQTA